MNRRPRNSSDAVRGAEVKAFDPSRVVLAVIGDARSSDAQPAIEAEAAGRHDPEAVRLRDALIPIAASMVRLSGGCESGHKAGRWHMHEDEYHAIGRRLAALARTATDGSSDE